MNIIRYILSATWFKELVQRLGAKSPKFFIAARWLTGFLGSLIGVAVWLNDSGTVAIPGWIINNVTEIIVGLGAVFAFAFTPVTDPAKLSSSDNDGKGEGGPGGTNPPGNPPKP